jgi:AraC-like DNA-binding protein
MNDGGLMTRLNKKVPIQPILYKSVKDYEEVELVWNKVQKKNQALFYSFTTNSVHSTTVNLVADSCSDLLIGYNCKEMDVFISVNRAKTETLSLKPNMKYLGFKPYSSCALKDEFNEGYLEQIKYSLLKDNILNEHINMNSYSEYIINLVSSHLLNYNYQPGIAELAEIEICNTDGSVKVESLCASLKYSSGYCREQFKKETGLSIKQASDVLKFQKILHLLDKKPHLSLCDLSYEAGYFDQAHMTKIFKRHTGLSPRKFKEEYF